jgi:hypothetical protein
MAMEVFPDSAGAAGIPSTGRAFMSLPERGLYFCASGADFMRMRRDMVCGSPRERGSRSVEKDGKNVVVEGYLSLELIGRTKVSWWWQQETMKMCDGIIVSCEAGAAKAAGLDSQRTVGCRVRECEGAISRSGLRLRAVMLIRSSCIGDGGQQAPNRS